MLNAVAWLKEIRSETIQGLSSIQLTFEPGTDPIRARQMVQEQLLQAHALPSVARAPVMLQPLSSTASLASFSAVARPIPLLVRVINTTFGLSIDSLPSWIFRFTFSRNIADVPS